MAKIAYTNNARTPTNHVERPLLVTSVAVMVPINTMTTAPGQNYRSIGFGPMT